jgi:demethylmenaquinone methyltransferase/2-methoxy-6-polyprenyl-1,4-benzoquinol methylase
MVSSQDELFTRWLASLEARHLSEFRIAEVTRALRALSSAYVQRRQKLAAGAALGSAGKRAAFALFYGPLHFLTVTHIVRALDVGAPAPSHILDLGCGTGVGGAAWALRAGGSPHLLGIDRHPWAVEESRRTYRELGVRGHARIGDLKRLPPLASSDAAIAAYTLNELSGERRGEVELHLLEAATRGTRVLIVEPISRAVTPWWDEAATRVKALGGREDDWRFPADLPPLLQLLDKSAGLHHQELTARSLYVGRPT